MPLHRHRPARYLRPQRVSGFVTHMPAALHEARAAAARGEVPVGAVVVSPRGEVLAAAGNETRATCDPTAHAEVLAIRRACAALGDERLTGCALWVTLEPCAMCAGAIVHARLAALHFAALDPKGGGVDHGARVLATAMHAPEIYRGAGEAEVADLLRAFFAARR